MTQILIRTLRILITDRLYNMHNKLLHSIFIAIAIAIALPSVAQRRINPVTPPPAIGIKKSQKKQEFDKSRLEERKDIHGNIILVDTVTGSEYIDSTAISAPVGNIYPLFHAVTIGVDIWDPVMRLIGTEYGGIGFWGELSLHNRFKPIFELGVSTADISPDNLNYTFKSPMAPYFKIGCNYNILYNSNPDYQLLFGLRYGFTPFNFTVENISSNNDYWDNPLFDIPKQSATVGYYEIVASIKVRLFKNVSAGWAIKYHTVLHESKCTYGEPMYIPGYGKRNNRITGSFSIMYTLPLNKKTAPTVHTEN